jgi:hypothetical protein
LASRCECGLRHLQRRQDAFGQERAERFAGDDLDDAAENVGRAAVVPFRARLAAISGMPAIMVACSAR